MTDTQNKIQMFNCYIKVILKSKSCPAIYLRPEEGWNWKPLTCKSSQLTNRALRPPQHHSRFKYLHFLRKKKKNHAPINPLSDNPTKWSNTLKQFVGKLLMNCLSVFDHFVGLSLKAYVRYFLRNFYFSRNDSPSKTMKDVFYFI